MSDHYSISDSKARGWLTSGYDLPWPAEIGSLLLRLYFGFVICWGAGISKFPLEAWFTSQVQGLGFPMPTLFAWLAAMSEVAGGVLLMLGLATRFSGFFLAFTLGTAAFVFHKIDPLTHYTSQHITLQYFWVYVFYTLAGAGRLSLDGVLRNRTVPAALSTVVIVTALTIACGLRTAPPVEETTAADLSSIESITLAGSFNDWSLADSPMNEESPGVWIATISVEEPTPAEFKFVGNGVWDLAAGESDQPDERFPVEGVAEVGRNAENAKAYLPSAGEYLFRLELPSLAYSVTRQTDETLESTDAL